MRAWLHYADDSHQSRLGPGFSVVNRIYGEGTIIFQDGILGAMKIISTAEAAKRLGVTANRVRAMIEAKRLKATKVGNVWLIDPKDLDAVKDRKVGRPRKSRKSAKK
jgi:excisionase family DNA binding protein